MHKYQVLLLACHAVRGAAELQGVRLHEAELLSDLRAELQLVALIAGLNVGPMPPMANPGGARLIKQSPTAAPATGGEKFIPLLAAASLSMPTNRTDAPGEKPPPGGAVL